MKQTKDKLFLPKLLRDILNVVYWFSIIGVGFFLLLISWMYFTGETGASEIFLNSRYSFPVHLDISDIGKLIIDNTSYEVSIFKGEGMVLVKNAPFGFVVFTQLSLY